MSLCELTIITFPGIIIFILFVTSVLALCQSTLPNPLTPKLAILSILLCLTPDRFTRQWETPGSHWANQYLSFANLPIFTKQLHIYMYLRTRFCRILKRHNAGGR